ncbi:cupin domain-containing protein [Aquimarina hainanensis]|uniref:Cupin domain-containing protein n=1 Tax=Aquimarina hainanensis TaxID=1578017 RepID=A0ABW5NBG9_9FLAO|nr:cupin domain-containing protein [Aquimarina sp. TRL1]QKX06598.1 cupin domain-containing protein [Aquimarina sp. TRL1]
MKMNPLMLCILFCIAYSCKQAPTITEPHKEKQTPIHVSTDEGKKWNVFGVQITGKILSTDTEGEYAVIVTETPPQGGPPKHIHAHEDELFYILTGKYTFFCGDKTIYAQKGDFIRLPKGIPHNFINTDSITGITMNTITPGGFENFFEQVATLSKGEKLSKKTIDSLATEYGVTFVKK